jgi:hypothetical protein
MSDKRKIRAGGDEIGLLSLDKLYRLVTRGDLDAPREFWSEEKKSWLPLSGIMFDIEPSRVSQMREAGVSLVSVLGSGADCPACDALQKKSFPIDEAPTLPPAGCSCIPWCRLTMVATS